IAAAGCQVRLEDDRLAQLALGLGGVGDHPVAVDTRPFLARRPDAATVCELARHAARSVEPIEDHLADAEFRRALAEALVLRVVPTAVADARRLGVPR